MYKEIKVTAEVTTKVSEADLAESDKWDVDIYLNGQDKGCYTYKVDPIEEEGKMTEMVRTYINRTLANALTGDSRIQGWKFSIENGSYFWSHPKYSHFIYATPCWESEEGITIEIASAWAVVNKKEIVVPFTLSGDLSADAEAYRSAMAQVFQFRYGTEQFHDIFSPCDGGCGLHCEEGSGYIVEDGKSICEDCQRQVGYCTSCWTRCSDDVLLHPANDSGAICSDCIATHPYKCVGNPDTGSPCESDIIIDPRDPYVTLKNGRGKSCRHCASTLMFDSVDKYYYDGTTTPIELKL